MSAATHIFLLHSSKNKTSIHIGLVYLPSDVTKHLLSFLPLFFNMSPSGSSRLKKIDFEGKLLLLSSTEKVITSKYIIK